jgi:hypothetical protein
MPDARSAAAIVRRQWFEIEDLRWCPRFIRDGITDWLQQSVVLAGRVYEPAAPLIAEILGRHRDNTVIDLCSGAGGPWRRLKELVEERNGPIQLVLTDKYPNRRALSELVSAIDDGRTSFVEASVDARQVPHHLSGVATLFTSIHHLPPAAVRQVLGNAFHDRRALAIFDFCDRSAAQGSLRNTFGAVLRTMGMVEPRRPVSLFFTYVVPLIPLAITWDAYVSDRRAYTAEELLALTADLRADGWEWASGRLGDASPVTYLVGCARDANS